MDQEKEIARLRALIDYAATSLESFGVMLAAAEQLRQAPLTELIDPILQGAQEAANTLWKALGDGLNGSGAAGHHSDQRTLN
ncbi:hypothetical protein [Paraburkholderia atlantica]|uniref:hypothetical protein n=1 Tax=Paraburkholderia atlantica TaxID=2654982 RepID=UPI00160F89E9|nr:hypothetical protein [Paraburkholderia atlantica]MBB5420793.1 hypothetical protein [Paraburkholderia atlantica]